MATTIKQALDALRAFEIRKEENLHKKGRASHPQLIGSPIHTHCKHCGVKTQTLSENHTTAPKTVCDGCEELRRWKFIPNE